jgi:hypothetical protein
MIVHDRSHMLYLFQFTFNSFLGQRYERRVYQLRVQRSVTQRGLVCCFQLQLEPDLCLQREVRARHRKRIVQGAGWRAVDLGLAIGRPVAAGLTASVTFLPRAGTPRPRTLDDSLDMDLH